MKKHPLTPRSAQGFTLIEMMVVVAIIGILGAIAYPAYTKSILKGKRAQGRTAVIELMQQQERYMTQNNCYMAFSNSGGSATPLASCNATASSVPFKTFSGDSASNAAYWLSSSACGSGISLADCVQVTATPVNAASDPEVTSLSITSTGSKSCTGTASSSNPKLCWP